MSDIYPIVHSRSERRPGLNWNLEDPRFHCDVSTGRWFYSVDSNTVYEMGAQLGQGGAAQVFCCSRVFLIPEGPILDDTVKFAAKVIKFKSSKLDADEEVERSKQKREVQIMKKLHHPGIVNLFDVIETDNEIVLVMELVPGGELFYKIVECGAFTEDQTRYILAQILPAIRYVHFKNVVHLGPGFYHVKVADFGLAKVMRFGIPEARTFVGTPQYWAPEVIESLRSQRPYGREADLWSLGCLIYVMLAGSYPFDSRKSPLEESIVNARFHFNWPKFERVTQGAKDLISGLLTPDPKKRITLEEVITHPWITSFHVPYGIPPLPPSDPFPLYEVQPIIPANQNNTRQLHQIHLSIPENNEISSTLIYGKDNLIFSSLTKQKNANYRDSRAIVPVRSTINQPINMMRQYNNNNDNNNEQQKQQMLSSEKSDINERSNYIHIDINKNNEVPRIPVIRSGILNRHDIVMSTEEIFNFDELLSNQMYILRKLSLAYIALRSSPQAAKNIANCIGEARNIHSESIKVFTKFETTCISALDVLPDLELAVTEKKPDLAISLFEEIKVWISVLKIDVDMHQHRIQAFTRHVSELIEAVRAVKTAGDNQLLATFGFSDSRITPRSLAMKFLEAGPDKVDREDYISTLVRSSLPPLIVHSSMAKREPVNFSNRVISVTSGSNSVIDIPKRTSEQNDDPLCVSNNIPIDSVESMTSKCFQRTETVESFTRNVCPIVNSISSLPVDSQEHIEDEDTFKNWYEGLREVVFSSLGTQNNRRIDDTNRKQQTSTEDINDMPYTSPGNTSEKTTRMMSQIDMTPGQVANEFLELLFASLSCSTDKHPRKQIQANNNQSSDASSTESSSPCLGSILPIESTTHHDPPLDTVDTKSPEDNKSWKNNINYCCCTPGPNTPHRKKINQKERCCQSIRTSEILIKALEELCRIEQSLRKTHIFWIHLNSVVERLCHMKSHVERLLHITIDSSAFTSRFYERLDNYNNFWYTLRQQAHSFIVSSKVKLAAMDDFISALITMADRVDTASAVITGEATAVSLKHARHCIRPTA